MPSAPPFIPEETAARAPRGGKRNGPVTEPAPPVGPEPGPAPAPAPAKDTAQPSQGELYLGLLAVRNEFVNLSELKHCLEVRRKLVEKNAPGAELGEVFVQQRYLTPQDIEYLHMIRAAES